MLVAIERNKLTYLYKYNSVRIDLNQLIDFSLEELKDKILDDFYTLQNLFDKAIPIFEQDHEIILLEIDKSQIIFKDGIVLKFNSIISIYPLTAIGTKLLEGRISDDFIVNPPVFESVIEKLKFQRSMEIRSDASKNLLFLFGLEKILNIELNSAIQDSTRKNLIDKLNSQNLVTYLDHLMNYNKTPSFLPEGNMEHICKIGVISIRFLGMSEDIFISGSFYKSCIKYKNTLNRTNTFDSYFEFMSIKDSELKSSYEKMLDIISKDYKDIDIFKVSYFFLAYKSFLNKNDNKIDMLRDEIDSLIRDDRKTAAFVLSLIGYTFSFENIYEGLHRFFNAPLLKSSVKRKRLEIDNEKPSDKVVTPNETSDRDRINADAHNVEIENSEKLDSDEKELENTPESQRYIDTKMDETPISIGESIELSVGKSKSNKNKKSNPASYNLESGVNDNSIVAESMASYDIKEKSKTISDGNSPTEFKEWIIKKCQSNKINHWNAFLDKFFINENIEITSDKIADIFEKYPEQKQKLFGKDASKLKKEIASFFANR